MDRRAPQGTTGRRKVGQTESSCKGAAKSAACFTEEECGALTRAAQRYEITQSFTLFQNGSGPRSSRQRKRGQQNVQAIRAGETPALPWTSSIRLSPAFQRKQSKRRHTWLSIPTSLQGDVLQKNQTDADTGERRDRASSCPKSRDEWVSRDGLPAQHKESQTRLDRTFEGLLWVCTFDAGASIPREMGTCGPC